MGNTNFEEGLVQMTKPEVTKIKHQDMLADAIARSKDTSVLSWWWLSVPGYVIATLLMKSIYMPHSSYLSNVHEFIGREKNLSILFFLVIPFLFMMINIYIIRKIYFLSGGPDIKYFFKVIWVNLLAIAFSLFILLIYFL